jgi:hemolysin D
VETFNFTRYGTVDGTVAWVSADALTHDPQNNTNSPTSNGLAPVAFFPARIRLNQGSLMVDGKKMPMTPGLNITAEIKTGRRSVLDYLLSPIQKTLDESVGER